MEQLDLSKRYSEPQLRVADYWMKNCRDIGRLCGRMPHGSGCMLCFGANGSPVPIKDIAMAELGGNTGDAEIDRKDVFILQYINHKQWRHFKEHQLPDELTKPGYYKKFNGSWKSSIINHLDKDDWRNQLEQLQKAEYRLARFDPNDPDGQTEQISAYVTIADGRSVAVNETVNVFDVLNGVIEIPLDEEPLMSDRRYTCTDEECGHVGKMRRVNQERTSDEKGNRKPVLRCTKCGSSRKQTSRSSKKPNKQTNKSKTEAES